MLVVGYRVFRYKQAPLTGFKKMVHGTGFGLTLFAACGLARLLFLEGARPTQFDPGGYVGVYGAELSGTFGSLGVTVVMLLMLVAGISWAFDLSWIAIGGNIWRWVARGSDADSVRHIADAEGQKKDQKSRPRIKSVSSIITRGKE